MDILARVQIMCTVLKWNGRTLFEKDGLVVGEALKYGGEAIRAAAFVIIDRRNEQIMITPNLDVIQPLAHANALSECELFKRNLIARVSPRTTPQIPLGKYSERRQKVLEMTLAGTYSEDEIARTLGHFADKTTVKNDKKWLKQRGYLSKNIQT